MKCPECGTPINLSLSKRLAPFNPARCLSCSHVPQFASFLAGMIGLIEFLILATACVLLYRTLR
jgi:hypothetical protein